MTNPIDYASAGGTPVSEVRFRPAVTLLMLANMLVAAIIAFLALIYFDRLGIASAILLVAAILTGVAIFRFLTRPQPRFGVAALLILLATAVTSVAYLMIHAAFATLREKILRSATWGVAIVHMERIAVLSSQRSTSS